jgi:hypothetical protein
MNKLTRIIHLLSAVIAGEFEVLPPTWRLTGLRVAHHLTESTREHQEDTHANSTS